MPTRPSSSFQVHVDPDDLALTDLAAAVTSATDGSDGSGKRRSGTAHRAEDRRGDAPARHGGTQSAAATRRYAFRRS